MDSGENEEEDCSHECNPVYLAATPPPPSIPACFDPQERAPTPKVGYEVDAVGEALEDQADEACFCEGRVRHRGGRQRDEGLEMMYVGGKEHGVFALASIYQCIGPLALIWDDEEPKSQEVDRNHRCGSRR